jgi:hypothetical protein
MELDSGDFWQVIPIKLQKISKYKLQINRGPLGVQWLQGGVLL